MDGFDWWWNVRNENDQEWNIEDFEYQMWKEYSYDFIQNVIHAVILIKRKGYEKYLILSGSCLNLHSPIDKQNLRSAK